MLASSEYAMLTKPQAMLANRKDSMSAGPAYLAAATPVRTKMPVPTMTPMPSRVTSREPMARLRWDWWASALYSAMLLVRKIFTINNSFYWALQVYILSSMLDQGNKKDQPGWTGLLIPDKWSG